MLKEFENELKVPHKYNIHRAPNCEIDLCVVKKTYTIYYLHTRISIFIHEYLLIPTYVYTKLYHLGVSTGTQCICIYMPMSKYRCIGKYINLTDVYKTYEYICDALTQIYSHTPTAHWYIYVPVCANSHITCACI